LEPVYITLCKHQNSGNISLLLILLHLGGEKPQILWVFGVWHFVMSPIGGVWRKLYACAYCKPSPIHQFLYSNSFVAKSYAETPSFKSLTDPSRQTDKQAGWLIAPLGPNAPSLECPPNVVPNSEFRTCPDPEFPNMLHSKFMNMPNVEFLNVPVCSTPMSYLVGSKWDRLLCYGHAAVCWCLQRACGACGGHIALDGGVASILALWR